jgi:hypothetical protein
LTAELPELSRWLQGWLSAKHAEGLAPRTLKGYHERMDVFMGYGAARNVDTIAALASTATPCSTAGGLDGQI